MIGVPRLGRTIVSRNGSCSAGQLQKGRVRRQSYRLRARGRTAAFRLSAGREFARGSPRTDKMPYCSDPCRTSLLRRAMVNPGGDADERRENRSDTENRTKLSLHRCTSQPDIPGIKKSRSPSVPMNPKYHSWQDYQEAAAEVFRDLGCTADVNKTVSGARGTHDVYVTIPQFGQECRWIVECNLWSRPVTKATVHALRSRTEDLGADRGVMFSESGFQEGARTAAQDTNILLQDSLEDFKETARIHMRRVALVLEEADEPDAPPVLRFPKRNRPYHLLGHDGRLFVANWGVPQAGNIAIVDSATRMIEGIIELDRYERPGRAGRPPRILQNTLGNIAVANGKLFVGQVFSDCVLAIDIDSQSIIKRIPIPGGGEGAVVVSPDIGDHRMGVQVGL